MSKLITAASILAATTPVHPSLHPASRPGWTGGLISFRPDEGTGGGTGTGTGEGGGAGGGQTGGATGAAGGGEGGQGVQGMVTMTQERLQELIDGGYSRGATKAERDAAKKLEDARKEWEKTHGQPGGQGQQGQGAQGQAGGQGAAKTYTHEEVQQLLQQKEAEWKPRLDQADQTITGFREERRQNVLLTAAGAADAHKAEEVAFLCARFVQEDEDGKLVVVNEAGKPRLNTKGDPLSVADFVKEFVDANPHHKRGANKGGAASGTQNGGGQTGGQTFDLNTPAGAKAALTDAFARQMKQR